MLKKDFWITAATIAAMIGSVWLLIRAIHEAFLGN
jgi:hypothetical protein